MDVHTHTANTYEISKFQVPTCLDSKAFTGLKCATRMSVVSYYGCCVLDCM